LLSVLHPSTPWAAQCYCEAISPSAGSEFFDFSSAAFSLIVFRFFPVYRLDVRPSPSMAPPSFLPSKCRVVLPSPPPPYQAIGRYRCMIQIVSVPSLLSSIHFISLFPPRSFWPTRKGRRPVPSLKPLKVALPFSCIPCIFSFSWLGHSSLALINAGLLRSFCR